MIQPWTLLGIIILIGYYIVIFFTLIIDPKVSYKSKKEFIKHLIPFFAIYLLAKTRFNELDD